MLPGLKCPQLVGNFEKDKPEFYRDSVCKRSEGIAQGSCAGSRSVFDGLRVHGSSRKNGLYCARHLDKSAGHSYPAFYVSWRHTDPKT